MSSNKKPVELLAPAGSMESLRAAINAGADAVYMGGTKFGARAYADNPEELEYLKAIDYAHLHGSQIYMTINTLFKESELSQLYDYLLPYYQQGLDAVIVQDMGVLSFLKRELPELPLHLSTQATITSAYGAKALKAQGAARVVAPRELSLAEITGIKAETGLEMESFVHGALCYCYSGQCLLSSFLGGRSGNRGRCAQPCRLPYQLYEDGKKLNSKDENYLLSPKDLCTLDILPELIEGGIDSLKIEGRMKSPKYTAGVVSIYRKYVDEYLTNGKNNYKVAAADKKMLLDLFDRGGFTEGYYFKQNDKEMLSLKEKPAFREGNEVLFKFLEENYLRKEKKEKLKGKVNISKGVPAKIEIEYNDFCVSTEGSVPLLAQNQPMTAERLEKQIKKTGNTPFVFEELEIIIDDGLFMPMQDINELRRNSLERVEQCFLEHFYRENPLSLKTLKNQELQDNSRDVCPVTASLETEPSPAQKRTLHVLLEEPKLFKALLRYAEIDVIEIDSAAFLAAQWQELVSECHRHGKACYLAMPYIFRDYAIDYFKKHLEILKAAGFDGFLVRSLDELYFIKDHGIKGIITGDYTLYSYNKESAGFYLEAGADYLTMPVELNKKELAIRGSQNSGITVYGYQPLMITAQCLLKSTKGCNKKPGLRMLKDRKGANLPVRNQCLFCYNVIYNGVPSSLLPKQAEVDSLKPAFYRLAFTKETVKQAQEITKAFIKTWINQGESLGQEAEQALVGDFTRGHFGRGIE